MTIRPFHPKDRAAIDELAIKLHAYFAQVDDMAESLPFASLRDAHGYMQRMVDDSDDMDGAIYVAEENGQVVGFIQGVIIDHQPGQDAVFDAVHTPRKDGWIGLLYVEPEQRGSGIGRALLDEMKRYFQSKNCDTLRLKVLSGNQRAIAFYEKYGFTAREVEMITKLQ